MSSQGSLLQICPYDSPPFGQLVELYRQAATAIGLENKSVFLGPQPDMPTGQADYLEFKRLDNTQALSRALNRYADRQWTIVLCHRYRSYRAALGSRIEGENWIALAHEYDMLTSIKRRIRRRFIRAPVRFAGVARGIAEELARYTGEVLVMPNALDLKQYRSTLLDRSSARNVLGIPNDVFAVGVVGRLHYKKRPQLALDAFTRFRETEPSATLTYVGEGPERSSLEARCGEGVSFAGKVADARTKMNAFDVLLHAASAEPFGLVILEAMDAGVPVVCKRGHGPEFILGDLGFYAETDTADGFSAALERARSADNAEIRTRGRQRADELFSVAAVSRTLEEIAAEVRR